MVTSQSRSLIGCRLTSCSASSSAALPLPSPLLAMRLSPAILDAVPWILFLFVIIFVLSWPSSSHLELEQCPSFCSPSDTIIAEPEGGGLVSEDTYGKLECFANSSVAYSGPLSAPSERYTPAIRQFSSSRFSLTGPLSWDHVFGAPLIRFSSDAAFRIYSRMRMGLSRAMMGARSLFCVSREL